MTTVWVVQSCDRYEGCILHGIFSDEVRALRNALENKDYAPKVIEWEVDKGPIDDNE